MRTGACDLWLDGDSVLDDRLWWPSVSENRGCVCVSGRWVGMFFSWLGSKVYRVCRNRVAARTFAQSVPAGKKAGHSSEMQSSIQRIELIIMLCGIFNRRHVKIKLFEADFGTAGRGKIVSSSRYLTHWHTSSHKDMYRLCTAPKIFVVFLLSGL